MTSAYRRARGRIKRFEDVFSLTPLFDNDAFAVVHIRYATRLPGAAIEDVYEIVIKRTEMEVLLHGDSARAFEFQIKTWQKVTPSEDQVEEALIGFSALGQLPLRSH
jgi:hypothetical protein